MVDAEPVPMKIARRVMNLIELALLSLREVVCGGCRLRTQFAI